MMWLLFSIFAGCCVAQFWIAPRVASSLKARHPEIHRRMRGAVPFNRLLWFVLFRRDRGLNDPELTSRTKQMLGPTYVALATWLAFTIMVLARPR